MAVSNPPSYLQGGSHPARGLRRMTEAMTGDTEGALAAGELVVSEKSGTPNMSVDVSAGRAFILGTESSFQGTYFVESRNIENLTVAAADATNPRKDIVVARVEDSEESGATDAWSLEVVAGTPAASPSAPALPDNSLLLATVDVAALASSITDANITTSTPVWAPAPVDTAGLVDGAVTEAKLAAGSVTSTKLAADSVSAAAIQAGAVGSSEIATGAVGSSEIGTGAVGSSELADGAVTNDKLAASGLDASKITVGTLPSSVIPEIDGSSLGANSVTAAEIAADAVGASELADNVVSNTHLSNMAANTVKVRQGSTGDPQDLSVGTNRIVGRTTGSVTSTQVHTDMIATDAVTSAKIAANAVGSSEIAANAVGASELADAYYTESESDARFLRSNADDTTTGRVTISNTNTGSSGAQALNIVAGTNTSPDAGISFQYGTGGTVINHGVFRMSNSNIHRFVFLQQDNSSLGDIQCQAVYYNGGSFGTSDLSMKNKLGAVPGLDFVDSLAPFTGTWKADESEKKQFFLGAQEVEAALEDAGFDPDDYGMTQFNTETDALAMDYVQLVPVLVQAVKDLKARVEELEGQ
jgi:hypothetical protein